MISSNLSDHPMYSVLYPSYAIPFRYIYTGGWHFNRALYVIVDIHTVQLVCTLHLPSSNFCWPPPPKAQFDLSRSWLPFEMKSLFTVSVSQSSTIINSHVTLVIASVFGHSCLLSLYSIHPTLGTAWWPLYFTWRSHFDLFFFFIYYTQYEISTSLWRSHFDLFCASLKPNTTSCWRRRIHWSLATRWGTGHGRICWGLARWGTITWNKT